LALFTFFESAMPQPTKRQYVATILVWLWGARLSLFLFYRILIISEDNRFDNMRNDPIKFFGFWFFQFLWVWIVSLPLTFLNSVNMSNEDVPLNSGDLVGLLLAIIGLIVEAVADQTKFNFKFVDYIDIYIAPLLIRIKYI